MTKQGAGGQGTNRIAFSHAASPGPATIGLYRAGWQPSAWLVFQSLAWRPGDTNSPTDYLHHCYITYLSDISASATCNVLVSLCDVASLRVYMWLWSTNPCHPMTMSTGNSWHRSDNVLGIVVSATPTSNANVSSSLSASHMTREPFRRPGTSLLQLCSLPLWQCRPLCARPSFRPLAADASPARSRVVLRMPTPKNHAAGRGLGISFAHPLDPTADLDLRGSRSHASAEAHQSRPQHFRRGGGGG